MAFKVEVHHYFHDSGNNDLMKEILARVKGIEEHMAEKFDNLQASLDAAGVGLVEIADDLNGAKDEIAALRAQMEGGLTPAEATAVQSRMDELVAKVDAARKIIDPAVPPEEVPVA